MSCWYLDKHLTPQWKHSDDLSIVWSDVPASVVLQRGATYVN